MITWERSCLWLSCCWTLAMCITWTTAAAQEQISPAPAVIGRGDRPDPGSPAPSPTQQSTADSTITHSSRNLTSVLAQTAEAATVSLSAVNTPTVSARNANPSTPSQPPEETSGVLPMSTPPQPTPTPSTPTIQPDESSSLPPSPAANKTTPIPSSAPPTLVDTPTVKTQAQPSTVKEESLCDIDPCVHLQQPCPEVKEVKGWSCRCPGMSPVPSMAPGPVVALEVMRVWPRTASIRWCAPYSTLTSFLVWVLREDGSAVSNASVSSWARQTSVFGLEAGHIYSVCVSAQNGASASHTRCVPVVTPRDGEAIALYTLIGGCVALLLMAVVLSICLHRQCRRGQTSGTPALLNPTMQMLHEPRLTSLVSIPNPAYSHPEEHAAHPPTVNTHYTHREQPKKSTNVNRK